MTKHTSTGPTKVMPRCEPGYADTFDETPSVADRLACLLLSNLSGIRLAKEIRAHFGTTAQATREDYIFAMVFAQIDREAERIGLIADLHSAHTKIAALEQRLAGNSQAGA